MVNNAIFKAAQPPLPCPNIERYFYFCCCNSSLSVLKYYYSTSLGVLGVIVSDSLTATDHVNNLMLSCASLLYALHILCSHGIPSRRSTMCFEQ